MSKELPGAPGKIARPLPGQEIAAGFSHWTEPAVVTGGGRRLVGEERQWQMPDDVETIGIERAEYAAFVAVAKSGSLIGACFAWAADGSTDGEGPVVPYPDRDQAICGAAKALIASLDAADPLRQNPAVTGVARQRMQKIREWAEELVEKHRPVAQAVSLFAEGV